MQLCIDGIYVEAMPDQTLADLTKQIGLDCDHLSERPLAAKIAGQVFNLNYVPLRSADNNQERCTIRRAVAASKGVVHLLRYSDSAGRDVYERTACFLLLVAIHRLWPEARVKMNCTVGRALYIEVFEKSFSVDALRCCLNKIIAENCDLRRKRVALTEAVAYFKANNRKDMSRLLAWRKQDYFDEYLYDDYADYHYGELLPTSGYLKVWDIMAVEGGFMFMFPDDNDPDVAAKYVMMPHFLQVSTEGERWCELMECETVADLNDLVVNGKIRELIRVNEALHEKRYGQIADEIVSRKAKIVMLAGPSSSEKQHLQTGLRHN